MDPKALKALQWKVFENVAAAQLVPLMRIGDQVAEVLTLHRGLSHAAAREDVARLLADTRESLIAGYLDGWKRRVERVGTPFTARWQKGAVFRAPMAHGDGNYFCASFT